MNITIKGGLNILIKIGNLQVCFIYKNIISDTSLMFVSNTRSLLIKWGTVRLARIYYTILKKLASDKRSSLI